MAIKYNEFGIEDFNLDLSFPDKFPTMTTVAASRIDAFEPRLYEATDSRAMKVVWGVVAALSLSSCYAQLVIPHRYEPNPTNPERY
jgi:hypothetical protein